MRRRGWFLAGVLAAAAGIGLLVVSDRQGDPARSSHRAEEGRAVVGNAPGRTEITVRVLDTEDAPVEGAEVVLRGGGGVVHGLGAPVARAVTRHDGTAWLRIPDAVARGWGRATARGEPVVLHILAEFNGVSSEAVAIDFAEEDEYVIRLDLAPSEGDMLSVQVIDHAGAPASGVAVSVVVGAGEAPEIPAKGVTDSGGVVRFRADWHARSKTTGADDNVRVRCDIPAHEPVSVAVTERAWDGEVLVVRMPPTGRVTIRLVGQRAEGTTYLAWQPLGPGRRVLKARLDECAATYDYVGVGLDLTVTAHFDDPALRAEPVSVKGPARAGDHVLVDLAVARRPLITARVIDRRGRPVLGSWTVTFVAAGQEPSQDLVRVPKDGVIEVPAPSEMPTELRLHEVNPGESGLSVTRTGSTPISAPGLVEVIVDDDPARSGVVSGTVRDAKGQPLAAATVVVKVHGGQQRLATARTNRQGEFLVENLPIGTSVDVFAMRPGYLGAEREGHVLSAQPSPLEMRLEHAARLRGTVLLDQDIPLGAVEVVVRSEAAGGTSRVTGCVLGGRWGFLDIEPGRAHLIVKLTGTGWSLFRRDSLELAADETADVEPIDLTGRIRNVDIRLEREGGTALASSRARLVDDAGVAGRAVQADREGRIRTVVPSDRTRLWVEVDGFVRAPWEPGMKAVPLRKAP